ncbi:MAG: triose-phosphate isomerase [Nitrospiraceae bacterium]
MRRILIVGNWKMHKTASEAADFVHRLSVLVPNADGVDVILAPPFTALHATAQALPQSSPFTLAAQNLHWEDQGAFTGEVSAPMLKELGCRSVMVGHSERRRLFREVDAEINQKVLAALRHELRPILCLGETLPEREAGRTEEVVTGQLLEGLAGTAKDGLLMVTVAYEPAWAIGTGHAASPGQVILVHELLRAVIAREWGSEASQAIRILYGGSVTPQNIREFLVSPQVNGALVGGACLDPQSFATIIRVAQGTVR